jgi:hypothetical protein
MSTDHLNVVMSKKDLLVGCCLEDPAAQIPSGIPYLEFAGSDKPPLRIC